MGLSLWCMDLMFSFSSFCTSWLSLMLSFFSSHIMFASRRTCSGLKGNISISCYLLDLMLFRMVRATFIGLCMPQVLSNSVLCCVRQCIVGVLHRQYLSVAAYATYSQKASWHSLRVIRAIYTVTEYCPGSKRYSSIRWSQKQVTLHCTEQKEHQ